MAVMTFISARADKYLYSFNNTPISDAIVQIIKDHPATDIFFIYNELKNYKTSAKIHTDDAYAALRQTIGLNPIILTVKNGSFYLEALQSGRFRYYGNLISDDNEPIIGASVMLLSPGNSSIITYGTTDSNGSFSIPCDKKNVIAKFTCVGYETTVVNMPHFAMGTITMQQAPISLSAVTVEADNTVLSTDRNIYIPSARQKKASQDAADLLRRMAIPQLVINPGDNSIKDVFGNSVSIYVNYHAAQPEELIGMRMTDVRKIEYSEYPSDPRFKGEPRVINFIVQEYEYGGYTKVSESFRTLNGMYNNTDIFSKFTYKNMTYDLYAGSDNQNYHHAGSDRSELYRLENKEEPMTISRKETFDESHTKINRYPVTFRATYIRPHFTARNTLSLSHYSSPLQWSCGDLKVNIHPEQDYTYFKNSPNKNNTVYYHGNLWGSIGSNASYDITPSFRHTHRNNTSAYESTLIQTPINNDITENAYNWGLQASGRIGLGQKGQLSIFMAGGQNLNKLIYQGSNNITDSYSNSFIVGEIRYRYQTRKISISPSVGFGFEHNSMNGIKTNDTYPRSGINAWFSINNKSQISASINYQTTSPSISMKANDIVRSNEFLWLTANPRLKNWRNLNSNLSYNLFLNNSFSLATFAGCKLQFNRVATVYIPYGDGNALLRDFINDGSYNHYFLGISANYKLFNNSLQLYANLAQNAYEITGRYKDSFYPFRIQLQAIYYWKLFNILASWGSPQNTLTENSNYIIRGRNFHMLSVGWGNGVWTVNLSAKNIFNKGWHYETWKADSPLYSEFRQSYSPLAHASLNLSVTYTIGYGKKVQHGNEVGAQSSAPSAIIQ